MTDTAPDTAALERAYKKYCVQCDETGMYERFMAVARARGDRVWDTDGREYLDLVLGYSALNFGHRPPALMEHARSVMERIDHVHSFCSAEKIELSRVLAQRTGIPDARTYFPVSGAMAVETALKLRRRGRIAVFDGGFHGYSCAAMHATADFVQDRYVDCDRFVRLPYADMSALNSADWSDIGLVLFEPVQGAGGFIVPPADWVKKLREITAANDVILVADEIQMGMGRAGYLASYQHFDIVPDVAVFSKSLSGGLWPLSAVVARGDLFDAIDSAGSAIGSTFGNNQYACSLALFVLQNMLTDDLLDRVRHNTPLLLSKLESLKKAPFIKDFYGIGYAFGMHLTDAEIGKKLQNFAHENGILLYVGGKFKDKMKIVFSLSASDNILYENINRLISVIFDFHKSL